MSDKLEDSKTLDLPDGLPGDPSKQLTADDAVSMVNKKAEVKQANVDTLFEPHTLEEGKYYIRMLSTGDYEAVTDDGFILSLTQKRASDLLTGMNENPSFVNLQLKNGTMVSVKKDARINHFSLRNIEFNSLVSAVILEQLIEGKSLKEITKLPGMPTRATILRWTHEYPAFGKEYTIAKKLSVDVMEDDILAIADNDKNTYDKEYLNSSKLRVAAREKLSKIRAIGYSEKVQEGDSGNHFYFDKSLIGLGSGIAPADRVIDVGEGKTVTNSEFMKSFSADDQVSDGGEVLDIKGRDIPKEEEPVEPVKTEEVK